MRLRIATRGSALALWQADEVARLLQLAWPDLETERLVFKTTGDRFLDRPLSEIGGKGLFTKELEVALADGDADIAVHSLKDMPTALPEGMVIAAVPIRGDVRDCVVTRPGEDPDAAAVIGTSSLRRACLARRRWPEARIEPIRGKVETRARRLHEEGSRRVDAVLLAWAGLVRLGMDARDDLGFRPLAPEGWIPAVGQGALAVECREERRRRGRCVAQTWQRARRAPPWASPHGRQRVAARAPVGKSTWQAEGRGTRPMNKSI